MSDAVKIMAVGCLTVLLAVAILDRAEPQILATLFSLFGAVLGLPGLVHKIESRKHG